jgi:hypothetical protein
VGRLVRRVGVVSSTTRSITGLRQGRDARRPGPVAQEPVHALALNRSCQRQTHGFDTPVRRMIAFVPEAVRRGQDDPCPPDVLLRAVPVRRHRLQAGTVSGAHLDLDPFAHPRNVGTGAIGGNLPLDQIH